MCIAAIIKKPVCWEYLQEMESDNPHGAGVAWFDGHDIQFRRGLTAKDILAMQEDRAISYPYLLHFRWATHGARVPELTHPFPTGRRALFGELSGAAPSVLIHNGVWNDCTNWEQFIEASAKQIASTSDTGILAYLVGEFNWTEVLDEVPWATALADVHEGELRIRKFGDTWVEYEGNTYSNLYWLPSKVWWEYNKDHKYAKARMSNSCGIGHGGWSFSEIEETEAVEGETYEQWARGRHFASAASIAKMTDEEWEAYLRARYGPRITDTNTAQDADMVSEDYNEVNSYLEKQEKELMTHLTKLPYRKAG